MWFDGKSISSIPSSAAHALSCCSTCVFLLFQSSFGACRSKIIFKKILTKVWLDFFGESKTSMKSQPWVSITSENLKFTEINQSKVWNILVFKKYNITKMFFFSWNHAVRVYWIAFKSKQRQLVGETSYLKKILLSQSVSRQRLLWIEISIQKLANYLCETILF